MSPYFIKWLICLLVHLPDNCLLFEWVLCFIIHQVCIFIVYLLCLFVCSVSLMMILFKPRFNDDSTRLGCLQIIRSTRKPLKSKPHQACAFNRLVRRTTDSLSNSWCHMHRMETVHELRSLTTYICMCHRKPLKRNPFNLAFSSLALRVASLAHFSSLFLSCTKELRGTANSKNKSRTK